MFIQRSSHEKSANRPKSFDSNSPFNSLIIKLLPGGIDSVKKVFFLFIYFFPFLSLMEKELNFTVAIREGLLESSVIMNKSK